MFRSARRLPKTYLSVDLQHFSIKVYVQHLTQTLPHYMVGNRSDDVPVSSLEPFVQVKVPSILVKPHLPHLFAEKPLKRRHRSQGRSSVDSLLPYQNSGMAGVRDNAIIDLTGDAEIGNFVLSNDNEI